jgi:hypothetical protein
MASILFARPVQRELFVVKACEGAKTAVLACANSRFALDGCSGNTLFRDRPTEPQRVWPPTPPRRDAAARSATHSEGMNTLTAITKHRWPRPYAERYARAAPWSPAPGPTTATDAEFRELCQGFQRSGGLVSADQLVGLMHGGGGQSLALPNPQPISQPISMVARWIVRREIVSLSWRSQTLLPLFQFGDGRACLRPGLAAVMTELTDVFDDLELALWFARSNSSLDGAAPADRLATHAADVWQAARTDRFIATGG